MAPTATSQVAQLSLDIFGQVQVLDLTTTEALKGFRGGGFSEGSYGYLAPTTMALFLAR